MTRSAVYESSLQWMAKLEHQVVECEEVKCDVRLRKERRDEVEHLPSLLAWQVAQAPARLAARLTKASVGESYVETIAAETIGRVLLT